MPEKLSNMRPDMNPINEWQFPLEVREKRTQPRFIKERIQVSEISSKEIRKLIICLENL
jgi:hypothetical protein